MSIADDIFGAVDAAAEIAHRHDAIQGKKEDIARAERGRCGNCERWMRRTCRPEKEFGHFKSTSSMACRDFRQAQWVTDHIEMLKGELDDLVGRDSGTKPEAPNA